MTDDFLSLEKKKKKRIIEFCGYIDWVVSSSVLEHLDTIVVVFLVRDTFIRMCVCVYLYRAHRVNIDTTSFTFLAGRFFSLFTESI